MQASPPSDRAPTPNRTAFFAGALAVLVGSAVLTGWTLEIAALKSVLPAWVAMKANTAVGFILIGIASLLAGLEHQSGKSPSSVLWAGRLAGGLAALIGLLTLAEYAFNWDTVIDHWLFPEPAGAVGTSHPGRMAPDTALCFVLLAVGNEFARRARQHAVSLFAASLLGALVATTGLVEILSYFTPALRTYGWGGLTMMALPTAVTFAALGTALVGRAAPRPAVARAQSGAAAPLKLFLLLVGLAVGIIATGSFYYRIIERKFATQLTSELSAIADLKVNQVTQWRKERLGDAAILFRNPAFTALVRRTLAQPADADAERELRGWMGKYPGSYDYDQVRLLDAAGVTRLVIPAGRPPPADGILQLSLLALRSGQMESVDLHRGVQDGRIHLSTLVPVLDEQNAARPLGVFVLGIDPAKYLFPVIQGWPTPRRTAETLLVRRDGGDVLYLNDLRFRPNAALVLRGSLDRRDLPAARAVRGETGIVEGADYRGVPVVAALRAVPESPWFLVAKVDQAEAFAPIRGQLWQIIAAVGIVLFAAGAGVGLLWWRSRLDFYREQVTAAEALKASEVRFRRLFEAARDGILILDAETGVIVDVNPFLVGLLGYTREVFLGKTIWELGFFREIVANRDRFAEWQREEYIRYEDRPLENSAGRKIEVEFVSCRYWVGDHQVIQCIIRDITDRRRAEATLREAQLLLAEAEKLGHVGGWELDSETQELRWTEEVFRIHEVDLTYRPTVEAGINFYAPASRPVIAQAVQGALERGEPFDVELEIVTAKGNRRCVHSIGGADPTRRKVRGFLQDITAQKKAEEEIHRLNADLERRVQERTAELAAANTELEAFAYSVSHDLRAPLRGIDGFSRILLEDYAPKLDEEGRDSIQRVRAATRRMAELIDDMLELSRVSRAELRRVPVDLSAMAADVVGELRRSEPDRAVEVVIAAGVTVEGDPHLLRIVMENLLGNAWKFTVRRAGARIEFGGELQEGVPACYVRDNGAGYDEQFAAKLFGAFQRLHSAEEFPGTGIGLATVQRIVHRHGGRVWAEGRVDFGATFHFTLRAQAPARTKESS